MAATRVYLGVHHASDVVGGLALGALTGGACALAVR
jgi:membrane-associated phospholipid phosphatase